MRVNQLSGNIILKRFTQRDPDELGTADYWDHVVTKLRRLAPYPYYVNDFEIELWHMSDPRLDEERRKGIANLEDYNTSKPGCQVAAGLNFGTHRIEIGLFPQVWKHDVNNYAPLAYGQIERAEGILAHELGHRYDHWTGFNENDQVGQVLRAYFDTIRPNQGHNFTEDFAEVYRAVYGGQNNTFSDGKEYAPSVDVKVFMYLLKDLRIEMLDSNQITGLNYGYFSDVGHAIWWKEYKRPWWSPWTFENWYALNEDRKLYEWINGKWQ